MLTVEAGKRIRLLIRPRVLEVTRLLRARRIKFIKPVQRGAARQEKRKERVLFTVKLL